MLNGGETMLNGGASMQNGGASMQNGGATMLIRGATMRNGNQLSAGFAAPARWVRGFLSLSPDNSSRVAVTSSGDEAFVRPGRDGRPKESVSLWAHSVTARTVANITRLR
jgi:hypothetical protein